LNTIGAKNATPFGEIIFLGRDDLFDFCLKMGAKIHPEQPDHVSPLLCAAGAIANAQDSEAKMYKKLVELGADQNQSDGTMNATPFALLVASGNKDHIDWGLAHGAFLNPSNSSRKATPLEHAARLENDKTGLIYKHLIEAGADINLPGTNDAPSLLYVLLKGKIELATWCFEHGAALLSKPEWHQIAYELAVESKNAKLLTLLKKQGIKFDPDLSPNLLFKGYQCGGSNMLNGLLKMNCQPNREVPAWGEPVEYSALVRMIDNHDIESFRKLFIFPDFINRNLDDIKRICEHSKDTAFLEELNKQGYKSGCFH
jgi:hypothetical protein